MGTIIIASYIIIGVVIFLMGCNSEGSAKGTTACISVMWPLVCIGAVILSVVIAVIDLIGKGK